MKTHRKLAVMVCSLFLGVGAYSVDAATLSTTDYQVLHLPSSISVFNAQQVRTPHRFVNIFNQKTLDDLNKGAREAIQKQGAINNKPNWVQFAGDVVKNMNFYQLQGENNQGHHVAYIAEVAISPDIVKLGLDNIAEMSTVSDNGEPSPSINKSYKITTYSPEQITQIMRDVIKKDNSLYGTNITTVNASINKALKKSIQAEIIKMQKESDSAQIDPVNAGSLKNVQPMTPEEMTLIANYLNTLKIHYNYYQPYKEVSTKLGKGFYSEERASVSVDNLLYPVSGFTLIRFTNDGPVLTSVLMNDPSFEFWQKEFKSIWEIQ